MDIVVFDSDELPIVLSALRAIVPRPGTRHYRFLDVIAKLHGGLPERRALPPAPHLLVAGVIRDRRRRKRLVQLGVLMALVDQHVGRSTPVLTELARALEVEEPAVKMLSRLATRPRLTMCAAMLRRAVTASIGAAWHEEGFRGLSKLIRNPLAHDRIQVAGRRWTELASYPPGSLGRMLWDQRSTHSCGLLDRSDLVSGRGIAHHIGHLISGYDASPAGEIQQAAFQAGYTRRDGFAHLLLGVLQFHLAIRIAPRAAPHAGHFDAHKVMTALARGARCTADLSDDWSFWDAAQSPLEALRAELQVPALPVLSAAA